MSIEIINKLREINVTLENIKLTENNLIEINSEIKILKDKCNVITIERCKNDVIELISKIAIKYPKMKINLGYDRYDFEKEFLIDITSKEIFESAEYINLEFDIENEWKCGQKYGIFMELTFICSKNDTPFKMGEIIKTFNN